VVCGNVSTLPSNFKYIDTLQNKQGSFVIGVLSTVSEAAGDLSSEVTYTLSRRRKRFNYGCLASSDGWLAGCRLAAVYTAAAG